MQIIKCFTIIFLFLVINATTLAANYPLEIIQPQANLDTTNRFYKAYPNLQYNVKIAVIGGAYPFKFELLSAPEGMTVDEKGIIDWQNPNESSTPYNIRVQVTDTENSTVEVSWTILVTTSGFRFIDNVNGTTVELGGDGSFLNPWKSLKDMYEGDTSDAKTASSYAGEFIYWRDGTYTMDAYLEGSAIPFVGDRKPTVWLAYPNENPVLDLNRGNIIFYPFATNTYFEGLDIDVNENARGMGIQISSSSSNVTFRQLKIHGITNGASGNNNACIFISKNQVGVNWVFSDNEFYDVNAGYGILGYNARKVLVENNTVYQVAGNAIGPKTGTGMWFIRANRLFDNASHSISALYGQSGEADSGDIEISYNLVELGGGRVRMNSSQTQVGLPIYLFRNTFIADIWQERVSSTNGTFNWYDNVIINELGAPDKMQKRNIDDPSA